MENCALNNIDSSLKGYSAYNQEVSIFEFGNVIVAKNYKEIDRVRLVSGGTSPHIQYVGRGMLTASIQGSDNRPPAPGIILRTLRELSLNHVKGILIIVQASSTDILNFGLSVERAINDDLRVMFLGVFDDCKNTKFTKSEKRGLSGVVLVNKVAGALAESNKTMPVIHDYCKKVAENMISDSVNIKKSLITRECLYCKKCSQDIVDVRSRGKPILKKVNFLDVLGDVVKNIFKNITADGRFPLTPGISLILLVNNMGALCEKEEYLFLKECIDYLTLSEVKIDRFYIGSYLNLKYDVDLSLTVLKVFDQNLLNLLDAPCTVPGWRTVLQNAQFITLENVISGCLRRKCRLSPPVKGPKLRDKPSNVVQLCLQFACDALISCEKMLNKMDGEKEHNGDTGTRLRNVAEVLNRRSCKKKLYLDYPFTFFLSLSKLLENTVGGTMGCIYCILFEAAAKKFGEYKEEDEVTCIMWLEALENACAAIKKYGNVEVGDNTLYDPLQACASTIRENITPYTGISAFGMGVEKAEESAQNTKKPGRKYPDAGAHAVGIWLRAVYEGVKLRCL